MPARPTSQQSESQPSHTLQFTAVKPKLAAIESVLGPHAHHKVFAAGITVVYNYNLYNSLVHFFSSFPSAAAAHFCPPLFNLTTSNWFIHYYHSFTLTHLTPSLGPYFSIVFFNKEQWGCCSYSLPHGQTLLYCFLAAGWNVYSLEIVAKWMKGRVGRRREGKRGQNNNELVK